MLNLMVIGIGNHARRIYVPTIYRLASKYPVRLAAGVDLKGKEDLLKEYFEKLGHHADMYFVDPVDANGNLSTETYEILSEIVKKKQIQGVIISTDPLSHRAHATWALSQGLHILMDKPITTRENVTTDLNQAKGIWDDYKYLADKYLALQSKKRTIFSINTQRRYEMGYQKVFSLIREVTDKFNVPVTSIQAMHSDGVWIFPNEVVEQMVHPYSQGYGKASHSGYHLFDIVWRFYLAGLVEEKKADSCEVFSSFLMPEGLLTIMNQNDYSKYFGDKYNEGKRDDSVLRELYKTYGEIDSFSSVRLLNDSNNICNISINLLHNGFSRRAWLLPSKDLYKGNGRVKHQSYIIQQGPFQCIQVHNYQTSDKQEDNDEDTFKLGGNNHFDIYVFRNAEMFGGDEQPLKTYNLLNLESSRRVDVSRLYHEQAKDSVMIEFIEYCLNGGDPSLLKSNIDSHENSARLMSSVYESHVRQTRKDNPISSFRISSWK